METGTLVVVLVLGAVVYFFPAIMAHGAKHQNETAITLLNLLLGWTLLGWVVALVWAFTNPPKKTGEAVPDAQMRDCPKCAEPIRAAAVKCKHCGSDLAKPVAA